jgi:hypothetical protein
VQKSLIGKVELQVHTEDLPLFLHVVVELLLLLLWSRKELDLANGN